MYFFKVNKWNNEYCLGVEILLRGELDELRRILVQGLFAILSVITIMSIIK